jgi:hypothetical protein
MSENLSTLGTGILECNVPEQSLKLSVTWREIQIWREIEANLRTCKAGYNNTTFRAKGLVLWCKPSVVEITFSVNDVLRRNVPVLEASSERDPKRRSNVLGLGAGGRGPYPGEYQGAIPLGLTFLFRISF